MATFLLLLSIVIAGMEVRASAAAVVEGYYPMASSCSTSDNYSSESQYKQNLRQLLSVLPTEVITGGGFHQETAGAAPDEVFGIMMCYADRKLDECQYCLAASTTLVTQVCPYSRRVNASYDACLLRYADRRRGRHGWCESTADGPARGGCRGLAVAGGERERSVQ
jgi:hypothetical protein